MSPIWNLVDEKPYVNHEAVPSGGQALFLLIAACLQCLVVGIVIGAVFDEQLLRWLGW